MFGVLNIHKPLHCTSHDVVAKVRKKLGIKKVGHCGTLDPLAEGVLPVCVGNATRLIEYFPSDKRYRAWITFGQTTPTWDAEGERIYGGSTENLSAEVISEALTGFLGTIQQTVPPHAAVHVNGKKLYEYARKGIQVDLPVRSTEIYEIKLVEYLANEAELPVAVVDIHCASGTYIRSIAQALGEKLGCGAYLSGLIRTAHGKFKLENSVLLETWLESPTPEENLLSPVPYLPFPQVSLSQEGVSKIQHGMKLQSQDVNQRVINDRLYLLMYHDVPVAVASGEETGRLKPVKVFHISL